MATQQHSHTAQPEPDPNSLALDFEVVSFDSARQALEEPPPGVQRLTTINWIERRRPLTESERRVTRGAMQWLLSLPQEVRPVELLRRYPRVANKLAECWSDIEATDRNLDDLLIDRRGGRQGFPPPVAEELVRLRDRWQRELRAQSLSS